MSNTNGAATATPKTPTALALAPPREDVSHIMTTTPFERGLEPTGLESAMKVCEAIAKTGVCGVKSAEDALVRVMTGRSIGLTLAQSLRGVYVVNGRPGLDASLMQALCQRHPECEAFEFEESTDTRAVLRVKRRGRKEQKIPWTIQDAERALLVKEESSWQKYPRQMLRARCRADGARLEFADVLFGLYSVEELRDGVIDTTGIAVQHDPAGPAPAVEDVASKIAAEQLAQTKLRDELLAQLAAAANAEDRKAFTQRMRGLAPGQLSESHAAEVRAAFDAKYPPKNPSAAKPNDATAAAPTATSPREPGVD
jgi:hypothetical protein